MAIYFYFQGLGLQGQDIVRFKANFGFKTKVEVFDRGHRRSGNV